MFYCTSNTILRELTVLRVDNDWSLFWKEFAGLCVLVPWLLLRCLQGRYRLLSKRLFLWLILGGTLCELVGARLQMYAYLTVGILISAPLIQAASMGGTAALGSLVLRDPLSIHKKIAMGVLVLATVLLLFGKELAAEHVVAETGATGTGTSSSAFPCLLAGLGSLAAGVSYSIHMVIVRFVGHVHWRDDLYTARQSMRFRHWIGHDLRGRDDTPDGSRFYSPFPVTLIMGTIFGVGVFWFGLCLYRKTGWDGFLHIATVDGQWLDMEKTARSWWLVGISGFCNMVGFFFQVQGLRMTSAVQVSLVAVSQFLFLALFGMFFFGEPTNAIIWTGVALAVCGVLLSAKR